MTEGTGFRERVRGVLQAHLSEVHEEPPVLGAAVDFLGRLPDGRTVVVEAKRGAPDAESVRDALNQIADYQQLLGSSVGLIVFEDMHAPVPLSGPDLARVSGDIHVAPIDRLAELIGKLRVQSSQESMPASQRPYLAVAFPPTESSQELITNVVSPVATQLGATVAAFASATSRPWVSDDVRRLVRNCNVLVVDLTNTDAGMMFLLGYALGIEKIIIAFTQDAGESVAFGMRVLPYEIGKVGDLQERFHQELAATLDAPF